MPRELPVIEATAEDAARALLAQAEAAGAPSVTIETATLRGLLDILARNRAGRLKNRRGLDATARALNAAPPKVRIAIGRAMQRALSGRTDVEIQTYLATALAEGAPVEAPDEEDGEE